MNPISFCIATGVNEKEYIKLLLTSLKDNTNLDIHEIIVWVDTDNQNTYDELIGLKNTQYPMMKIGKNPYKAQLGNQFNSAVMIQEAKNDIICFLHSDMVVGRKFDIGLLNALDENPNNIVCSARIEPPLHPTGPEKIIKSYGMSTGDFDYNAFQDFSTELQNKNIPNGSGYFAPSTFYKKTFLDILGGFDTQFRCSREDSDFIIKIEMNKLNPIISWNAVVYHFTCVSSRGKDWFKKETDLTAKVNYQKHADMIEMKRFMRKWGYFGHDYRPRYDINLLLEVDSVPNFNILFAIEQHFNKLFINDIEVIEYMITKLNFDFHYYSNKKLGHSLEDWKLMKKFYPLLNFENRISYFNDNKHSNDFPVLVKTKTSVLDNLFNSDSQECMNFFTNMNVIVSQSEVGKYELFEGITIEIGNDLIDLNLCNNKNRSLKELLTMEEFDFE